MSNSEALSVAGSAFVAKHASRSAQSARGLAHSKTGVPPRCCQPRASVLECGRLLPLSYLTGEGSLWCPGLAGSVGTG